ncbi:MAG: acyl-CoA desaturase [Nitrospira sp.]|nr:acyl-CoA desaturase [Nitrospira sp.]
MYEGLIDLPWWGYVIVALVLTHITIASVTIFLHRHQAHKALELHPVVSHFFRFWLWVTTGQVTQEWVAVHRKHHANVEGPDDPHSPQQVGIKMVLWLGMWLYRIESVKRETLKKYGYGTPHDWMERNVYKTMDYLGVVLMLGIDVLLFGVVAGSLIWITQILWIPFWAAGVINGIGHWWGYRNYELTDVSTNIVPWGIIIGGEELHNNHHTYPSSAKFSSQWWELDIAWLYIRALETLRLATVKKIPPKPTFNPEKQSCDLETVKAVVANRFQVMAGFARDVLKRVHREELKKANPADRDGWMSLKRAKRLMLREATLLDDASRRWLAEALEGYKSLQTVYVMKQKLQAIWQRSAATHELLLQALDDWCRQAEATGIHALREFSHKLRTYSLTPATP